MSGFTEHVSIEHIITEGLNQLWYLSLFLHLFLQVIEVSGISIIILRIKSLFKPAFLFNALVLLDLVIVHLH